MHRNAKWFLVGFIIIIVFAVSILLNQNNNTSPTTLTTNMIEVDDGDLNINWGNYQTKSIRLTSAITFSESGIYHLTGTLYNGGITIKGDSKSKIKLILDNVAIYNSTGPAIACLSGDDLVVELVGENTLVDGSIYSEEYDEDVTGNIYSKADLVFQGDGTISITGQYQDAIVAKDDLTFRSGIYNITAADDGIRGKDSVRVTNGSFFINATNDAIKATNDTEQHKGFVLIENGDFNLSAGAKGIKATRLVSIKNGNFSIETTDDSLHSDSFIRIEGGSINISAGDDAVHANKELEITGGNLMIAKSYEGLEAQKVTIADGYISIAASDDGINAGGGADGSSTNRPGQNIFDADEKCILAINGGEVYVNASGDGVDSNGWLYINGGRLIVDGPTNNGNGALDAGIGIVMNGGEAIALGTSGMAENLGQTSTINNISIFLNQIYPADTTIEIRNSDGDSIVSHVSAKSFEHIAVGSPQFELGKTYSLYINEELYANISISGIVTTFGDNHSAPNNNMPNRATNNRR